ncbi:MAG: dihydroorotate dehydrogenase-like protein [Gammaproteobacteria bacterium]|nr:dihydroorotate dehydrogenase-like protein [Gammaproteobacteria bacterium]
MDLSTRYLGLKLKNPIIASSSPLTWELGTALQLQDSGASAIIMPSLFEEQVELEKAHLERFIHHQSLGHSEVDQFHPPLPDYEGYHYKYISRLQKLKDELDIPVIANLNGVSDGGWVQYARDVEQAGADALELNVYYIAASAEETSAEVEQRYIDILQSIQKQVNIPVCMKLSHQFSAIIPLVKKLEQAGASGVSLFNRFYQPDIDLETLHIMPKLDLSDSHEAMLRIRWVAMLRQHVKLTLSVTGGVHDSEGVLKALLAGADVTCMCSVLLKNGPEHISRVLQKMLQWMGEKEYESVQQLKGSLSYTNAINPSAYERSNYLEVMDSYSYASGVMV